MRRSAARLLVQARAGAAAHCAPAACQGLLASLHQSSGLLAASGTQTLQQHSLWTSRSLAAEALTSVAVTGDVASLIEELDATLSGDATAKDVADAALALSYLQAKGNRRIWGKVLEKAASLEASFDASSLSVLLWALTTANVGHYKTVYELSGPATRLLGSFSPSQLAVVVEGLGKAGVTDRDWYQAVSTKVVPAAASYSPEDLAKVLYGFAAASQSDTKLVKALAKELAGKAASASSTALAQATWSLATLGHADKPSLDAFARGLASANLTPQDAAATSWALGSLGYKADTGLVKALSGATKGGLADLSFEQAVGAAWGLALLGDKDLSPLFKSISAAVSASPETLPPASLALLFEAATLSGDKGGAKPPDQVYAYSKTVHALVTDNATAFKSAADVDFAADVASASARALGARYKPEVDAALAAQAQATADGLAVPITAVLDGNTKLAVEPVLASQLTSAGTPRGSLTAKARILEARGFKLVPVSIEGWSALPDIKAKAKYVLAAAKAAVPGASSKLTALERKLDEPFDPYAE